MITIGVIGRAQQSPDDVVPAETLVAAEAVGRLIAERRAALVSGGTTGVMEAASRGAKEAGGLTIGILPGLDRAAANAWVDVALPTGLGTARNLIDARGCDALVMIGGGAGTLMELAIAYQVGRPVVILRGTGGWADRIGQGLVDGRFLDERRIVEIRFADTPEEAVATAYA
ncbi:MAG: TIGR00725 family protein, partial [Chloroflexi bacterium]|nr:TIGR00725 family protein [Chloroflexota bacterium]